MMNDVVEPKPEPCDERYIIRHALIDRLFHWISAVAVLVLLLTAFLPILGIKFSWITTHWVSGFILTAAVVAHLIRAIFWQSFRDIHFGLRDIRELTATLTWLFRLSDNHPSKPGKYSPAQKLMHLSVTLTVLVALITGLMMMVKIDTPWWDRDLYWLSDQSWGIVYVLHGFSALFLMAIVMIHIYFAFRREKLMYTRSMISGTLSMTEYKDQHDPQRWQK